VPPKPTTTKNPLSKSVADPTAYARRRREAMRAGTWRPDGMWGRVPRASISPTMLDIAWAAGFIEGEGGFGTNGHSCGMQAKQVNPEPLFFLRAHFGGTISYTPQRDIYAWTINGARARGFMMTIYAMLSARRRVQVRFALRGC
jgi:hypothetical protein